MCTSFVLRIFNICFEDIYFDEIYLSYFECIYFETALPLPWRLHAQSLLRRPRKLTARMRCHCLSCCSHTSEFCTVASTRNNCTEGKWRGQERKGWLERARSESGGGRWEGERMVYCKRTMFWCHISVSRFGVISLSLAFFNDCRVEFWACQCVVAVTYTAVQKSHIL